MLTKHPDALTKTRQEHDKVFGVDFTKTSQILKDQPSLLDQCPYTIAFNKETL
jgi:hypothetical protein